MNRQILYVLLTLFVGAAVVTIVVKNPPAKPTDDKKAALAKVRTLTIESRTIQTVVRSQGTVVPARVIPLVSEVAGRVLTISKNFQEGGFFEENEVLFTIDATDYELAAISAKGEVARAQRALARERQEAELARSEWELRDSDTPPDPLVLRVPQLKEAEALLEAALAGQKRAARDLERTEVRTPFRGRVQTKSVDVGHYLVQGMSAGVIYSIDYAEVRLPVPDSELAFIDIPLGWNAQDEGSEGPAVELSTKFAGQELTWNGVIVRSEGEIDPRTRVVHLIARVENPYGDTTGSRPPFAAGLYVNARIRGRNFENVTRIPRQAVRRAGDVLVVDDSSSLRRRSIETIRTERDELIVRIDPQTPDALHEGDRLCLSTMSIAFDGMKVETANLDPEEEDSTPTSDAKRSASPKREGE